MNPIFRGMALAVLLCGACAAQAADTSGKQGQGMGQGSGQNMGGPRDGRPPMPPPEAIKACENKSAQASCSFTGRRGETVTGQCMTPPDKSGQMPLACCPPHGPGMGGPGGGQGMGGQGMQGGMTPPQQ